MRAALVALALLVAGCPSSDTNKPAPQPAPPPPPVAAPAVDAAAAAPAKPKLPERAEVEMSGTLALPAGKTGEVEVWVTDGPCWTKDAHVVGRAGASTERWGVEVFVPQGTQLWVCARLAPKKGEKATLHAEAGPFLGKGAGEVIFSQVALALKPGAPVEPPAARVEPPAAR